MLKPILLAAAAGLTLSACAAPQPTRHVFISGPGAERVYVIRHSDGRYAREAARDARRHARYARQEARAAVRIARLDVPHPSEIDRIVREARAAGEAGRLAGERARVLGETARLRGEDARRRGEEARVRGEEARRRGEIIRAQAERLREQCERGEIACEIVDRPGSRTITITRPSGS